jgi:uncharacterized protein (TIGR02145 family)
MKTKQKILVGGLLLIIINLNAQDFLISFSGTGASTTVSTVIVKNMTRGTDLTINGSDKLRLSETVTGIADNKENTSEGLNFMPNPMKDYSKVQFKLAEQGLTIVNIYDLSGRKICESRNSLNRGRHTFRIMDLNSGIYLVTVKSGSLSASGRLMCTGADKNGGKIVLENSSPDQEARDNTKGIAEEVTMQYTSGDILKLTGISGEYSTIVTDVPTSDKTITFNFIACKDGSGNSYPVVFIGSAKGDPEDPITSDSKGIQIWMGENLKTATLNDGTAINNVAGNQAWSLLTGPAFCWYDNTPGDYGALYNWHAVGTGKLCPTGWRVPSDDEWLSLVQYLGGNTAAGGKLKESGTAHWESPNTGATNLYGFTALPGGWRDNSNGSFNEVTRSGYWWTSTMSNVTNACYRCILSTSSIIYGYMSEIDQKYGFSVRCIKSAP